MSMLFRTTSAIAFMALTMTQPACATQQAQPPSKPAPRKAAVQTVPGQRTNPRTVGARERAHAAKAPRHADRDEEDEDDRD